MFLFHWCLNAIRCRRDTTLETTPLSPSKYNGLPPAIDCELQRQLVDDIPESTYDVIGIGRPMPDEETLIGSSSSFQDRPNPVYPAILHKDQRLVTELYSYQSELRDLDDVMTDGYFHPGNMDVLLGINDVATNGTSGHCGRENETSVTVDEETGQVTNISDTSCNPVPLFTHFCMSSLQLVQPHLQQEIQHEASTSDKQNSSAITDKDLPGSDADHVDFSCGNLSCYTDTNVIDSSQRNVVASFPVDTVHDPLVTIATSLVNFAFNAAVKIINGNVTTSGASPTRQPVSRGASNSVHPLCVPYESTEESEDPAQAAARAVVDQVLSEALSRYRSCVFISGEGERSITTDTCLAPARHSYSPPDCCEPDTVNGGATSNATCALMSDAATDDESVAIGCLAVDHSQVLVADELVCMPTDCDCRREDECAESACGGPLTFTSQYCRSVSPPFTACSPDNVSEISNDNSVIVGLFDDACGHDIVCDEPTWQDHLHPINHDVQSPMLCSESSAEPFVELSRENGTDDAKISFIEQVLPSDDNCPDTLSYLTPFAAQSTSEEETWSSYQSSCRPEDYFFHRYVIPIDQLDTEEATWKTRDTTSSHNDRDDQRSKMQLDLKANEQNNDTDMDADIKAVAAFCRAMFTPVETDADEIDIRTSSSDFISSPETPDTEDRMSSGRPTGVRRCISLRTSPGTPHKKKSVRFADALGLDLEYVRQIQTVDEPLPTITGDSDEVRSRRLLLAEASAAWRQSRPLVQRRYLCACFQASGTHPDFIERVHRSRVVLESCDNDDRASTIHGVVRVANVAYRKTVAVRVSTDAWATQTDVAAQYVPRSNDGTTDRFSFQIVLPRGATDLGRRVEFAVYFTAFFDLEDRSETYWDNNFGANYCFECYGHDDGGSTLLDAEMDTDDGQFATWLSFV